MESAYVEALAAAEGLAGTPAEMDRLSARFGSDAARWAVEQWSLRKRGRSKFTHANRMLFDREGLEMASHEAVSAWRASLFPAGVSVIDLTCGLGGDLIGLARRGPCVGFELDMTRAEFAEHNLRAHDLNAEVRAMDGRASLPAEFVFADPMRRSGARRTHKIADSVPDPTTLHLDRCAFAAVKLSPACADEDLARLTQRVRFVGHRGECVEATATFGDGQEWTAKLIGIDEELPRGAPEDVIDAPGAWLFDPHPAAVRADALGTLCQRHRLMGLGTTRGYLTGDDELESAWLRAYRVLWFGPNRERDLRKALRSLEARVFEVKVRGVAATPPPKPQGERPVSLVLYRSGAKQFAVIAEASP